MNTRASSDEAVRFTPADLAQIAADNPRASLVDQIFALVAARAGNRRASAGTKLPSVRQLAEDCDVSRDTVARAYERLVAHGVVDARRGSGYYVKSGARRSPIQSRHQAMLNGPGAAGVTRWRTMILKPEAGMVSRTGVGTFPDSWQDEEALTAAVRAVARQTMRPLTQYSDLRGYPPLRQQLQLKLQEVGIMAEQSNILVTSGAVSATHLVCQTFLRGPRENVMVESPGPPLLIDRLMSTGMEIYYVPRLVDGPDLEILRAVCEKCRPRFFFCSSVLHNPTCTNIAPHKAFQLLQLAEEFDLTIVEDDTYGDLPGNGSTIARLATLDQLKRVIYISGFSKTIAPGLRCGFVAASPERIDWMLTYHVLQTVSMSDLSERVLYKALSGGSYRRHCEHLRTRLNEVRPRIVAEVERAGLTIDREPDAGMFLWASLGSNVDATSVAERMLEQGHLIAPGRIFSNDRSHASYLRINIAESSENSMLPVLTKLLGRGR